jgi:hypothetical protein
MRDKFLRREWEESTFFVPYMIDKLPINDWAMTKGSLEKENTLGNFLKIFLELDEDEKELHTLFSIINHCAQRKGSPY